MKKYYFNRSDLKPEILKAEYQAYQPKHQAKHIITHILIVIFLLLLMFAGIILLGGIAIAFSNHPKQPIMTIIAFFFILLMVLFILWSFRKFANTNSTKVIFNRQFIKIYDWRYHINDQYDLSTSKVSYNYFGCIDDITRIEEIRLIVNNLGKNHEYILTGNKRQMKKLMYYIDNQFI